MKKLIIPAAIMLCIINNVPAQTVKVPASLDAWDTVNVTANVETFEGRESIFLKSGSITIKNADLRDGTIEADISLPQQRGFPGFAFRMQDRENFENFYLRPHQSGNPDATQYTPMFNGQAGWQLYHGEGYSAPFTFRFNQWHHVKIELNGLQAQIYMDDMSKPLINVKELLTGWKSGKIGISGSDIHIANVQYTVKQGTAPAAIPVPENGTGGLITQWQVSNVTNMKQFDKVYQLSADIKSKLKWTTQRTEPSGTLNLARFSKLTEAENAMVVKLVVDSESDQVKELKFGFSDFVLVYLNDKALYQGADSYMSRDYRFLGTIGYFDGLFLPLKKGRNELWFVLSEQFGGWGIRAKFEDMKGIALKRNDGISLKQSRRIVLKNE